MTFEGDLRSFLAWVGDDQHRPPAEFGLFEAPDASGFCVLHHGKPCSPFQTIDTDWVYALRLCHRDYEARWQWRGDTGTGAILDDAAATANGWELWKNDHASRRLLRGTARKTEAGWTQMADGQSRPYWIPIELQKDAYAFLAVTEYLQCETRYGNCGVVAERWTGLVGKGDGDE